MSLRHLRHFVALVSLSCVSPWSAGAQETELRMLTATPDQKRPAAAQRLGPADLDLTIDGVTSSVTEVAPASDRGVTLYLDASLSRPGTIQRISDLLISQVETLVSLGKFEIVLADPEPRAILPPSQDVDFVRQALERAFVSDAGEDALRLRRRAFLSALGRPDAAPQDLAEEAVRDEIAMLRAQSDELLYWMVENGRRGGQGVLLLVSDALGNDPLDFYLSHVTSNATLAALSLQTPTTTEIEEAALHTGWSVFPIGLSESEASRALSTSSSPELPIGFRLRLGARDRDEPEPEPEQPVGLEEPPVERFRSLAASTGALAAIDVEELEKLIAALPHRVDVTYESPKTRQSELRLTSDSVKLSASRASLTERPRSLAELAVRRVLKGEIEEEEIDMVSQIEFDPQQVGRSAATLELLISPDFPPPWRLTIGIHTQDDEVVFRHEEKPTADLLSDPDQGEYYRHTAEIILPRGTDAAAVFVESDRGTGSTLVDFVDVLGATEITEETSAPAERLQLKPLPEGVLRGRVEVEVETTEEVSRVLYVLNGKPAARRRSRPFKAKIDVGRAGRTAQLIAVAFDRDGNEIDRDRLVINEPPESFWVRIVEPGPGLHAGPTDVEARVKVPNGSRLDEVDFYWNNRRVAAAYEPPYRRSVPIPVSQPEGFLRVEAKLSDGRIAEDVLLVNRPGFGEQIGVELVELYVVASDRDGKPVRDLEQSDFEITEDGALQALESFEMAGDLPLTVGLAMDSSSSLFRRMPAVQEAANGFVRGLESGRDRAFLVGFGSEATLRQPTTRDLEKVREAIDELEPQGTTAVWGALSLSMDQLEGITGRKSLVVFYDGDDEDSQNVYEKALRRARRARIPIYLILVNDAAARTEGRSFSSRAFVSKLDRLARAGGGKVYYVSTTENLEPIFAAISEELRSHYLLTYYPALTPGGPLWRPVEVKVKRRGLRARTIEGRELY
ncbi:MAG: VWA domain-containing protein [Acidobacteriota bacterium]